MERAERGSEDRRCRSVCGRGFDYVVLALLRAAGLMPSKLYIEERMESWRKRCLEAERLQRLYFDNAQSLAHFIKMNCKTYAVDKETALENGNYIRVGEDYYLHEAPPTQQTH
jgi:hypothetical protein